MPRDDHATLKQQRRSTSAVRGGGARYAPYTADCSGLKAHQSCPEFYPSSSTTTNSPDSGSDPSGEVSSTATLVNSSFDSDRTDSPFDSVFDKSNKLCAEKKYKNGTKGCFQPKKLDHFVLLIDAACKIMVDIWPQSTIPNVFRLQSGATYGYSPETRGFSVDDFPATQQPSDLVSLKKFITELLKRSRSTAATFQTALCYLEAARAEIPKLQRKEMEGFGTRGEPVDHEGRVVVDPEYVAEAEEENRKLARNMSKSKLRKPHMEPSFPLPDLPSPLLCPRRTLMGALVLAAKFVQDKCYSNRAWAKLCGLPPREVSRCERALGDALGWRLWVGREQFSACLGGIDLRASTSILIGNYADEPCKPTLSISNVDKHKSLTRSATWDVSPSREQPLPSLLRPSDTEYTISPVPSLISSSGTGSSNWPSGNLSPVPSPFPMFVSNDLSSIPTLNKIRLANLMHTDTVILDQRVFDMQRNEANVFDIRVGNGQEVY